MDDPNLIPNSTLEQKETMTSVSPPKRTIVLGVVNTTGMKSTNLNRKRRWDQPPEEVNDSPCVKKVHLSECPISEIESPETISSNPSLDRISDINSDLSNRCDILNSNATGFSSEELSRSESEPCEEITTNMDIPPDDISDRLSNLNEGSSSIIVSCSNQNECESTVPIEFSDSVCDKKVNSFSPELHSHHELRLDTTNPSEETESPMKSMKEKQKSPSSVSKNKSSTVISHQSEELRRIMFSYDESSSDSDISDGNNAEGTDKRLNEVMDELQSDKNKSEVGLLNRGVENIHVPSNQSTVEEAEIKRLPCVESETDCRTAVIVESNVEALPNKTGAFTNNVSTNSSVDKIRHESPHQIDETVCNIPNQKNAEVKSNKSDSKIGENSQSSDPSTNLYDPSIIHNSFDTSEIEITQNTDDKSLPFESNNTGELNANSGVEEVCGILASSKPISDAQVPEKEEVVEDNKVQKEIRETESSLSKELSAENLNMQKVEEIKDDSNLLQLADVAEPKTPENDNKIISTPHNLDAGINEGNHLECNLLDKVSESSEEILNGSGKSYDLMKDKRENQSSSSSHETTSRGNIISIDSASPVDLISLENHEKNVVNEEVPSNLEKVTKPLADKSSNSSSKDISIEESKKVANDIQSQIDIEGHEVLPLGPINDLDSASIKDNSVEMSDSNIDHEPGNASKLENIFSESKSSSLSEEENSTLCDTQPVHVPKEDNHAIGEDFEKSLDTPPLNNNVLPAEIKEQPQPETSMTGENNDIASHTTEVIEAGSENIEETTEKTSISSHEQLSVQLSISKATFEEKSFKITNRSVDESEKSSIVSSSKNIDPEVMEVIFGSSSDHQKIAGRELEDECLSVPSADSDSNIEASINLPESNSPPLTKEDSLEEVTSDKLEINEQNKMDLDYADAYNSDKCNPIDESAKETVLKESSSSALGITDDFKEESKESVEAKAELLSDPEAGPPEKNEQVSTPIVSPSVEEKLKVSECDPTTVNLEEVVDETPENRESTTADIIEKSVEDGVESSKDTIQSEKFGSYGAMHHITAHKSGNTEDETAFENIDSSNEDSEVINEESRKEDTEIQEERIQASENSSVETNSHEVDDMEVENASTMVEQQSKEFPVNNVSKSTVKNAEMLSSENNEIKASGNNENQRIELSAIEQLESNESEFSENNKIEPAENNEIDSSENIEIDDSKNFGIEHSENSPDSKCMPGENEAIKDVTDNVLHDSLSNPVHEDTSTKFTEDKENVKLVSKPEGSVNFNESTNVQGKELESEHIESSIVKEPKTSPPSLAEVISLPSENEISESIHKSSIDELKSEENLDINTELIKDLHKNETIIEADESADTELEALESEIAVSNIEECFEVENTTLEATNETTTSEKVTVEESFETDNNTSEVFSKAIHEEQSKKDTIDELPSSLSEVNSNKEINLVEIALPESSMLEEEVGTPEIIEEVFVDSKISEKGQEEKSQTIEEESHDFIPESNEEDDFKETSVVPPFESELNEILDDSKDFEDPVEISVPVALLSEEANLEPVESSLVTIEDEVLIGETKSCDIEITDTINSPIEARSDISFEPLSNNITDDNSKILNEEIESYDVDVVEEIVTCESPQSDKLIENELEDVIDDDDDNARSPSLASEETLETVQEPNSDQLEAVIENDTTDLKESELDNQNEVFIDSEECIKTDSFSSEVLGKDTQGDGKGMLNSINKDFLSRKRDNSSTVNSITKPETSLIDEEMEVDESSDISPPEVKKRRVNNSEDSSFSAVINTVKSDSKVLKDIGSSDIPLLKTVPSPLIQKHEVKHEEPRNADLPSFSADSEIGSKLEPITLRLYKDNLSIKTDDLDSPKRNRSPKLSSEIRSHQSPLSPQNKQLEFTLKIAKDVNTNKPKATMSPKRNMSPSSSWKLDSGYPSPGSPGDPLKIKISKPTSPVLSKDVLIFDKTKIKEEPDIDTEDSVHLPKPPIEIGSVLKKIIESEKIDVKKEGTSILEQALSSPSIDSPNSLLSKKRGRPRKILVSPGDVEVNPLNHSPTSIESPSLDTSGESVDQNSSRQVRSCRARTQPIVVKTRKPRGGGVGRGGGRGGAKGVARPITSEKEAEKIQEKLSEYEKAELAKIEARKEKMRLDRIAKNEAKKAKKLAKKLKDEERRKRIAAEKAEKAAAAAPQVFEEETRMSAPDSRGHTPAPASAMTRLNQIPETPEESQNSINTPNSGIKKGRMEIPMDPESDEVRVDQLAEYQWQGSELCMIQEQVSLYLGVKSFKRKYPDLKRRLVEAEERTFLEDSGLVPKSMCDLGLTAVSSAEILDIMYHDFPDKYEEFRGYMREKESRELSFKQKALSTVRGPADKSKGEPREQALEAAAMWNLNLNRERREERRCALDLQTFTVHYPKTMRDKMVRPALRPGLYPVPVIPGQFSDYYKTYTPTELMYFPLNTVMYGPLKPNERRPNHSDGSDSSSSSSDDSSGPTSCGSDTEDEENVSKECKVCNGEKKTNSETHPEILLQCSQCKGLCHPTCQEITPEMLPHIKKYSWHCSNCKKCVHCKNTTKEEKMLFCDLCDRGYHLNCVGLKKSPESRWHCSVCSFCTICGSKDPGGAEWHYEYKKTEKGVRLYQRTLCVPCSKTVLL